MTLGRLALNSEHTQSLPWHSTVPHAHLCRPVQDDSYQISVSNIREAVTSFSRMVARYKDHDASQSITQYPLVGYAMYSIAQGEYSARISNPMLTLIAITAHDLIAMGWTDGEDMFMIRASGDRRHGYHVADSRKMAQCLYTWISEYSEH
jgi:hypothetical protein